MPSRTRPDAVATTGLALALLFALVTRDDFRPPPTPVAPQFVLEVTGASIGSETSERGTFWTIDARAASVTVSNTKGEDASARVRFLLVDGPCGGGQSVEVDSSAFAGTVVIPPGGATEVLLDEVEITSFGKTEIMLESTSPACPPFATDPRSISFQIYELDAAA